MKKPHYLSAIIDILPLAISVVPWGILCGSIAIEIGFSPLQAQCMSLMVFAGATQLSAMSIINASGSTLSLFASVVAIHSRHFLYSATFSEYVKKLSFPKKVLIAFFLTDEMFAVTTKYKNLTGKFVTEYAIISGLIFYIFWNLSTFIGIYISNKIKQVGDIGLEFAVAATFIAMVVPTIKSFPIMLSVLISGISSLIFHYLGISNGLLISALLGMFFGFISNTLKING